MDNPDDVMSAFEIAFIDGYLTGNSAATAQMGDGGFWGGTAARLQEKLRAERERSASEIQKLQAEIARLRANGKQE